jgi:PIN domain nuclease of toxin-antitoxin system
VRLLLDTVTFMWSMRSPERISRKPISVLEDENAVRELSVLSLSEIAIKAAKGTLNLSKEDIAIGLADLKVRILPYLTDHAFRLFGLPLHHADPFDHRIIAQALAEGVPVVTPDQAFKLYHGVKVIW